MFVRLLIFLLLIISTPLFAEKIAVVGVKMIMQTSEAMKGLNKQLESRKSALEKELSTKEESLKKTDKDLSDKRDILSAEVFEKKAKEFREQVIAEQKDAQTKAGALEKSYISALEKVNAKVMDVIKQVAQSEKIDIVMSDSQVLFCSDHVLNVSDEVVKKLNEELSQIKMNDTI